MQEIRRVTDLKHATLILGPTESDDVKQAAMEVISNATGFDEILVTSSSGARVNLANAFFLAIQADANAFKDVAVGKPREIQLLANYLDDDHFLIDTDVGPIRVTQIEFHGELRIEETVIPVVKTAEYRHAVTGEPISRLAAFAPQSINGVNLALELHRIAESGETLVTMRRLPDEA
jgi:hypothetical protein